MSEPPGGLGPWFAALAFSTSAEQRQTHLIPHTQPHLVLDALNRRKRHDSTDSWVLMLKVGPFERWNDCVSFSRAWMDKTRGMLPHLKRGMELYQRYRERYALRIWVQTEPRPKQQLLKSPAQQQQQQQQHEQDWMRGNSELEQLRHVFETRPLRGVSIKSIKTAHATVAHGPIASTKRKKKK